MANKNRVNLEACPEDNVRFTVPEHERWARGGMRWHTACPGVIVINSPGKPEGLTIKEGKIMGDNGSKGLVQTMTETICMMTGLSEDAVIRQSIILGLSNWLTCPSGSKELHVLGTLCGLSYRCLEHIKGEHGAEETTWQEYSHEFEEPEPMLVITPHGQLYFHRGSSKYAVTMDKKIGHYVLLG